MDRQCQRRNSVPGHDLFRNCGQALSTWLLTGVVVAGMSGCTFLDWVDKKKPPEVPGEEQARLERLKKQGGGWSVGGPASMIQASPESVEFGDSRIDVESQQTIVFSNPSPFAVTVVKVIIDGTAFTWSNQISQSVIPPRGQLTLTVTFRPAERLRYSASLWLEIDSAGGRFTRVRLQGRGITK